MKIRHVFQPDDTGCGIAVLAMLLDTSYYLMKSKMIEHGIFEAGTNDWGTTFNDLRFVLEKQKIKTCPRRKFKKWSFIPAKVAIASTNHDKDGIFHWVLFVRDIDGFFIYDPGKKRKKIRDLRGKMTGWFIQILC